MKLQGCAAIQLGCVPDYSLSIAISVQTVKEHLKGYEKGLTDAKTTPRSKEVQMATVQAKLQGYSEVQRPPFLLQLITLSTLLCWADSMVMFELVCTSHLVLSFLTSQLVLSPIS